MDITDSNLLFCHGISEGNVDREIWTLEYKKRTVYECLNNIFTDDFGSSYLNLHPINIDDIPLQHKISRYTPDLPLAAIYIASENSVSTLTTPSYSPRILILFFDYPNLPHAMKKYYP